MKIIRLNLLWYLSPLLLAACVPETLTPTASVMPAPGKSVEVFAADQATCKQFADQQTAAAHNQANNEVMTTALTTQSPDPMAAVQATAATVTTALQQQYDAAYSQCMYAKGNQVPGFVAASPPPQRRRVRHVRTHRQATQPAQQAEPAFVEPTPTAEPSFTK